MAKEKTIVGSTVDYILTAHDAQQLNAARNPESRALLAGERVALRIDYDRGGDCIDGTLAVEKTRLAVERRNRGYGLGQWDWRTMAEAA